ncbi:hypothetical protein EB73_28370 [Mycobacterium sp. SWH-M3]|nr:hypothetical protein EB73_28370 [Mycobacterium sp. SWH-M3]
MGLARESFGAGGGPGGVSLLDAPLAPQGSASGSGAAAQGFSQESDAVGRDAQALADQDVAANAQLTDALGAAGVGRARMDSVIAAAVADVEALGLSTSTPEGQRALVAAIRRHLEDTKSTLQGADADATTRAAGADTSAAGYSSVGATDRGAAATVPASASSPAMPMGMPTLPTMPSMPMGGGMPAGGGMPMMGGGLPLAPLTSLAGLVRPVSNSAAGLTGAVPAAAASSGQLPSGLLPPGKASEKGLQKYTVLINRAVSEAFPEIKEIGGWRQDSMHWHPDGLALDIMIPNPTSPQGVALGDRILNFLMTNKERLGVDHAIWRQNLYDGDGAPQHMENRGSLTANHFDHVHVASRGGGYPRAGQEYRL